MTKVRQVKPQVRDDAPKKLKKVSFDFKPKIFKAKLKRQKDKTHPKKVNLLLNSAKSEIQKKKKKVPVEHNSKEMPDVGETNERNLKRKFSGQEQAARKKLRLMNLKKKDRKNVRKQNESEVAFERGKKLKRLWEELRKSDCEEPRRRQLVEESMKLIRGHAKELAYAHDTVRVLEWVFGLGTNEHRATLFYELKDSVIQLAKSKYGKYFLIKVFRCGSKEQKNYIVSQFYSQVINLMCHTEAATVVEVAFNECASAAQRAELVQEFYGPSYRFFKSSNLSSLQKLLEEDPGQRVPISQHMKAALSKILQKSVIQHSIVHFVAREFMAYADPASRSEIIELLRPVAVEMLHTKDGSRAAMHCVWHGTAKDRKVIIKSLKSHVVKIAVEEFGHMVLLALFDSVDDTVLLEKYVISELISSIREVSENTYGRRVLLYLLCPREKFHFHPAVVRILEQGDDNPNSKKELKVRRAELKKCIVKPLLQLVVDQMHNYYNNNSYCAFVLSVLKYTRGLNGAALRHVAELAATPYTSASKNTHIIESSGSNFMLKKIITEDKEHEEHKGETFSEILAEVVVPATIQSWTLCNRGCFLLVSLLETDIPSVVNKIKESLYGWHNKLSKRPYTGAEILLKKLKEH